MHWPSLCRYLITYMKEKTQAQSTMVTFRVNICNICSDSWGGVLLTLRYTLWEWTMVLSPNGPRKVAESWKWLACTNKLIFRKKYLSGLNDDFNNLSTTAIHFWRMMVTFESVWQYQRVIILVTKKEQTKPFTGTDFHNNAGPKFNLAQLYICDKLH